MMQLMICVLLFLGLIIRASNESLQAALAKANLHDDNSNASRSQMSSALSTSHSHSHGQQIVRQAASAVPNQPSRPSPTERPPLATSPITYSRPKTSNFGHY